MRLTFVNAALACLLLFAVAATAATKPSLPVDINRATTADLMQVPGMTATWAARIVRFRPYRTKLDLLEKGIVSADVYRRIRDGIVAHQVDNN